MSQAEELLNSLSGGNTVTYAVGDEPHIVVNSDRTIVVPDELKHIAVQFDHNIETVTFDCPRYWDKHDFSKMHVYINYMRPDGYKDQYPAENLRIDDIDSTMIHFEWTISKNVTNVKGNISFLICIKTINDEGKEEPHWNSRLNQELVVDEGMECTEQLVEYNQDVIEHILTKIEEFENYGGASDEQIEAAVVKYLQENPIDVGSKLTIGTVELLANKWVSEENYYRQRVDIDGVTEYSQVDLTPSINQLAIFYEKDLTFVTENDDGVVTVYAIGQKPANDYIIQVTIKEVSA